MTRFAEIVREFVDSFNGNDLDAVMKHFAEDAVFRPGAGKEYRGRAAIAEAMRPLFENALGTIRFVLEDQVLDEANRKATVRWVCQHDLGTTKPFLKRWLFIALFGRYPGWYGTDILHFDEHGKVTGKFSYAQAPFPSLRRNLGAPDAAPGA